jgi:hypothetical protein
VEVAFVVDGTANIVYLKDNPKDCPFLSQTEIVKNYDRSPNKVIIT